MSQPTDRNAEMISRWQWWGSWRRRHADTLASRAIFGDDRPPPAPGIYANPTLAYVLDMGSPTPMRVERCYRSLTDEQRAIARGRYLLCLSWPSIGRQTGLTVKQLEHRHTEILDLLGRHLELPYIVQGNEVQT